MQQQKVVSMKLSKLQKRVFIVLVLSCLAVPVGIFLPSVFKTGDAWGEWSAQTVKDLIGYVPQGLSKYSEAWKAPLSDYTLNASDKSLVHQSGYYIVCGIIGTTVTYGVLLLLSKLMAKNGK